VKPFDPDVTFCKSQPGKKVNKDGWVCVYASLLRLIFQNKVFIFHRDSSKKPYPYFFNLSSNPNPLIFKTLLPYFFVEIIQPVKRYRTTKGFTFSKGETFDPRHKKKPHLPAGLLNYPSTGFI